MKKYYLKSVVIIVIAAAIVTLWIVWRPLDKYSISFGEFFAAAPPTLVVGDRVITIMQTNIRNSSRVIIGLQPLGVMGTVIGGPAVVYGYTWWRIDFDSGFDGWVFSGHLNKYTTATPTPVPTSGDTVPPTVAVVAPQSGATVAGVILVSANASDNVGVAGVQFQLDGIDVGSADTTMPYGITLDTTTQAVNGTHILTARARDATGNATTSKEVLFTINNVATPTPTPTRQVKTIQVGGVTRSYIVYRPGNFNRAAVLALHGKPMTAEQMEKLTQFNREADAGGFLAVYPQGNIPLAFGYDWDSQGDTDVKFIDALISRLIGDYNLDTRRVYVAGVSKGGKLAYHLACRLASRIAAVGVVAGIQTDSTCNPSEPVSVVHIHGTNDDSGYTPYSAVPDTISFWRRTDVCPAEQTSTYYANGTSVTKAYATPCKNNTEVTLYTVKDGTHTWFGSSSNPINNAIEATPTLWRFFAAHPKM